MRLKSHGTSGSQCRMKVAPTLRFMSEDAQQFAREAPVYIFTGPPKNQHKLLASCRSSNDVTSGTSQNSHIHHQPGHQLNLHGSVLKPATGWLGTGGSSKMEVGSDGKDCTGSGAAINVKAHINLHADWG